MPTLSLMPIITTNRYYFRHAETNLFQGWYIYILQLYDVDPTNNGAVPKPQEMTRKSREGIPTTFLLWNSYADPYLAELISFIYSPSTPPE